MTLIGATGNHLEAMETLLKLGAKVDDTTTDNLTPVHVASHCNFPEAVQILLAYKADVNARALNNFAPINIATQKVSLHASGITTMPRAWPPNLLHSLQTSWRL